MQNNEGNSNNCKSNHTDLKIQVNDYD